MEKWQKGQQCLRDGREEVGILCSKTPAPVMKWYVIWRWISCKCILHTLDQQLRKVLEVLTDMLRREEMELYLISEKTEIECKASKF